MEASSLYWRSFFKEHDIYIYIYAIVVKIQTSILASSDKTPCSMLLLIALWTTQYICSCFSKLRWNHLSCWVDFITISLPLDKRWIDKFCLIRLIPDGPQKNITLLILFLGHYQRCYNPGNFLSSVTFFYLPFQWQFHCYYTAFRKLMQHAFITLLFVIYFFFSGFSGLFAFLSLLFFEYAFFSSLFKNGA